MSKNEIVVREENGGIRVKIEANKTSLIAMLVALVLSIAEDFNEDVDTILDIIEEAIYAIDDGDGNDEIEKEAPFKSEYVRRIMELGKVTEPVFEYLVNTYKPHTKIIISSDGVELVEGLMGVPMRKEKEDKVERKACYCSNCRR